MPRVKENVLLLAANVLIPLGIFIFFTGFFRGSVRTSTSHEVAMSETHGVTAPFDKVVFMMIDALRRFEIFFQCCVIARFDAFALADRLATRPRLLEN